MTGQDVIDFIKEQRLENAEVVIQSQFDDELAPIAFVYDNNQIEIVEDID